MVDADRMAETRDRLSAEFAAEEELGGKIVEAVSSAIIDRDITPVPLSIERYYKAGSVEGSRVIVEVLGWSPGAVSRDTLFCGLAFTGTDGETRTALMYGPRIYKQNDTGDLDLKFAEAPELLRIWDDVHASAEKPIVTSRGGGIDKGHRVDRILPAAKLVGQSLRLGWRSRFRT